MTCLCPGLKLSGFCFCVVLLCSMLLNVHFLLRELHKARHPDVGVTRLRLDDTLKVALVLVWRCGVTVTVMLSGRGVRGPAV